MKDIEELIQFKSDFGLNSTDLLIYMAVLSNASEDGLLVMKQSDIAEICGVAKRTVIYAMAKFEEKGIVSIVKKSKKTFGINQVQILK